MNKHEIDADATQIVNTILLWRIYDCLILLLPPEHATRLTQLHERGEFLGPNPAYRPDAADGEAGQ